ncbi:hypothetical protein CR513_18797, partial [Mucuna pruriens]
MEQVEIILDKQQNQISLLGVAIIVENAAYLANKQGLSVTDATINALKTANSVLHGAHPSSSCTSVMPWRISNLRNQKDFGSLTKLKDGSPSVIS